MGTTKRSRTKRKGDKGSKAELGQGRRERRRRPRRQRQAEHGQLVEADKRADMGSKRTGDPTKRMGGKE